MIRKYKTLNTLSLISYIAYVTTFIALGITFLSIFNNIHSEGESASEAIGGIFAQIICIVILIAIGDSLIISLVGLILKAIQFKKNNKGLLITSLIFDISFLALFIFILIYIISCGYKEAIGIAGVLLGTAFAILSLICNSIITRKMGKGKKTIQTLK